MKKKISIVALLVVVVLSISAVSTPALTPATVAGQGQRRALILSSLEQLVPMGYRGQMINAYLTNAGYAVTFLADTAVTIDVLVNQLNNYDMILWRTNLFMFNHTQYWYVGEVINSGTVQKYSEDFAAGRITGNVGVLGVNVGFFVNHLKEGSLGNVKLVTLISSRSSLIAPAFLKAGVTTAIFCQDAITLSFGLIDSLTAMMVAYLASGNTVATSVFSVVSPYGQQAAPKDPLDDNYSPPFWYEGSPTLTITL